MYQYFNDAARKFPEHTAVEEPGRGGISYCDLDILACSLRDRLRSLGVRRGDRVGIYAHKSIDSIACILGILKAGAAYVPVDPLAPVERNAFILSNCSVRVALVEKTFEAPLLAAMSSQNGALPKFIFLEGTGGGRGLKAGLDAVSAESGLPGTDEAVYPDDLAYILYTSGSTGKPKGVMLSHLNGTSFVDWCIETFEPQHSDRFSAHAPMHFDLSIFDIYVAFSCGGTLVLVTEDMAKEPLRLAQMISESRISVWYSAPSILTLLVQYGHLEKLDCSSVRLVLFAGEVFPVKHLRAFKALLPHPRYFNLYGPTETNVCTFYEIPAAIPPERTEPFPIGAVCNHLKDKVVDEEGGLVEPGQKGELCILGPAVMQGYWNLPEQTSRAFFASPEGLWHRTGDIVIAEPDGNYILVGRRDRMVKRRGYRVELGEIEAGLYRHAAIKEAAVISLPDPETGVRIRAFVSCQDGKRPSTIEMKKFCMDVLPHYMIPDSFTFQTSLPKTSTDKIDYQKLKEAD
jgi:amino acid adenylation domain-containing protein